MITLLGFRGYLIALVKLLEAMYKTTVKNVSIHMVAQACD